MTVRTLDQTHLLQLGNMAVQIAEKAYYAGERTDEHEMKCWKEACEEYGIRTVNNWAPSHRSGIPFERRDGMRWDGKTYLTFMEGFEKLEVPTFVKHFHVQYLHEIAAMLYQTLNTLPHELHEEPVGGALVFACKRASNTANQASIQLGVKGTPGLLDENTAGDIQGTGLNHEGEGVYSWSRNGRDFHNATADRHNKIYCAMRGIDR